MHPAMRRAAIAALAVSAALALSACRSSHPAAGAAPATSAVATAPNPPASPHASAAGSATTSPSQAASDCENLAATTAVKAAVTRAYEAAAHLDHIQPRPGGFRYGGCGGVMYAETRFTPSADATTGEQVALQDEGSSRKYFRLGSSGTWTYLGTGGFPDAGGCLRQIPNPMAAIWDNCSSR